jgi:hypothetical protein
MISLAVCSSGASEFLKLPVYLLNGFLFRIGVVLMQGVINDLKIIDIDIFSVKNN